MAQPPVFTFGNKSYQWIIKRGHYWIIAWHLPKLTIQYMGRMLLYKQADFLYKTLF